MVCSNPFLLCDRSPSFKRLMTPEYSCRDYCPVWDSPCKVKSEWRFYRSFRGMIKT